MLANLLFCLNATVPIFLLMVLGYVFKKINIFNDGLTKGLNNFVFKVALPVLVYKELATSDVEELWDAKFVLFCFLATVLSIIIAYTLSFLFKEKLTLCIINTIKEILKICGIYNGSTRRCFSWDNLL